MTKINLHALIDALGGAEAIPHALVTVSYRDSRGPAQRGSGATVIFPAAITVAIADGEPVEELVVEPTGPANFARIKLEGAGLSSITRNVAIPDEPEVDFYDLVDVDPSTYEPIESSLPAWDAAVAAVAASAAAAGESAADAGASADEAKESATEAAASTAAAGFSSSAAAGAATSALARATEADAAADRAESAATSADASSLSAAASRVAAESAAASSSQDSDAATGAATAASSSASAAATSATTAATSSGNAAASAVAASNSEVAASGSAAAAADSAQAAATARTGAQDARDSAFARSTEAADSAAAAAAAAAAIVQSMLDAEQYRDEANSFASAAGQSALEAAASAVAAELARTAAQTARTGAETALAAAQATTWGGTSVASDVNLDNLLNAGRYYFASSTPSLANNYPFASGSGLIEVLKYSGTTQAVEQRITYTSGTMGMQGFFQRRWLNSWGGWVYIPSLRINNPGDQPGVAFSFLAGAAGTEFNVPTAGVFLGLADLNTITLNGSYVQTNSNNGTLARNYPVNLTYGVLDVVASSVSIQQRWTPSANSGMRGMYIRNRSTNGVDWSAWVLIPSLRVNNPGDQPGADYFFWNGSAEQQLLPTGVPLGTADLNSITLGGFYVQSVSSNGTTARNYPIGPMTAVLEVVPITPVRVLQRIRRGLSGGTTGFYERTMWDGVWQPWRFFAYQRVDQSAGRAVYTYDDLNSREQMIYGDTGWRDVSADLANGWTGNLYLRRVGNSVTFGVRNLVRGSTDTLYSLPSGFGLTVTSAHALPIAVNGQVQLLRIGSGGSVTLNAAIAAAIAEAGMVTWPTSASWPTTLPGTAVGSIPA